MPPSNTLSLPTTDALHVHFNPFVTLLCILYPLKAVQLVVSHSVKARLLFSGSSFKPQLLCSTWQRSGASYSHTLVLVSFRTCQTLYSSHFDEKKNVSALGACLGLFALARTCMNHDASLKEKRLQHLLLAWYLSVSVLVTNSRMN